MTLAYDLKNFTDGSILFGDELNNLQSFALTELLRTDLAVNYINPLTYPASDVASPKKFFSSFQSTAESIIDTGNSSNVMYDNTRTNVITASATANSWIPFCYIFDDFEAAFNTTKWTRSSVTVVTSGGFLSFATIASDGVKSALSNGASGLDFKSFSGNSECVFKWKTNQTGNGTLDVQISDGTTHVAIRSTSAGVSEFVRVVINKGASTFDVYLGDSSSAIASGVSIAALSNWYLRFASSPPTGSGTAGIQVESVGYLDGSSGTATIIFTKTATASADAAVGLGELNIGADPAMVFSANSGTNYSTADCNKTLAPAPVAGTGIRFKITKALPTTISAVTRNIQSLKFFGGVFG